MLHKLQYITTLHIKAVKKYKEAKQQARAASNAEALKNKPENKDKERAQKIRSDAQTDIEKNLKNFLASDLSILKSKLEQLTKIAYEQLRNNN